MATTKTLKPTNVTISIPEFTDQPDQRVNSNCIDKEADAINSLSDQIANILNWKVYKQIGTSNGSKSSIAITLPNSSSGKIMVSADSIARNFEAMYRVTSGGSVAINEIVKGSQVTVSTSGATITITTSNSGSSVVYEMRCYGGGTATVVFS
jgi:hypothetical protein